MRESEIDIETYRLAIDNVLFRNCYNFDALAPRIERTIQFLIKRGAILNINYDPTLQNAIRMYIDHTILTEKFIDFLIKYSPNLNKRFLKHLTVNQLNTASSIIKYFVSKTQTVITDEIFQHAIKYGTHITIKALLELGYHPVRSDTKLAKNYYKIDQDYELVPKQDFEAKTNLTSEN